MPSSLANSASNASSNDTLTTTDRTNLQVEFSALYSEIDRIATATQFNGTAILTGGSTSLSLQIGANNGNTVTLNISPTSGFQASVLEASGAGAGAAITTQSLASARQLAMLSR